MKRISMAAVAALGILTASQALAQTATIELAPDQRTRIKEYVVKERVRPITVEERISIGATLPATVELQNVPSAWGPSVSRYRYVYHDDRVVLVEPSSRKVIQIID